MIRVISQSAQTPGTTEQRPESIHGCRSDEILGLFFFASELQLVVVTEGFVLLVFPAQLEASTTNKQRVGPKEKKKKAGSFRSKAAIVKKQDSHRAVSQRNVTILTCLGAVPLMRSSICFYWWGETEPKNHWANRTSHLARAVISRSQLNPIFPPKKEGLTDTCNEEHTALSENERTAMK